MFRLSLLALVLGYLPGALIFRLPGRSRAMRAALAAEERAFWAVILSAAWSLGVVLLLASISTYTFGRLITTNLIACGVLVLILRRNLVFGRAAARLTWHALVPAAIVAAGIWLYFPPSEYVIGGKDPGTYMNEGIQLAQRGALVFHDDVIASVPVESRAIFFPKYEDALVYSLRFMGFLIKNPDTGAVVGQFPHLFPASIAIGYGLNGLTGARDAISVWGILGLLGVYFAAARFLGRAAAAGATALLAIHIIQDWFARYPNGELVMQAFVFAAVLAFARAVEGARGFFGAAAGVLLGLLLFARFEVVIAMAGFSVAATLLPAVRQRSGTPFVLTMCAATLISLLYMNGPLAYYYILPLQVASEHGGWWWIAALVVVSWFVRRLLRIGVLASFTTRVVPVVLAASLVALAIYAYYFRHPAGRLAAPDAYSFRTYSWFITPWILGAAVVGAAVLILRRFWRDPAFFLTLAISAVFFFYKLRIVPEHFWAERRFLPVVLPGTMICLAGLGAEVATLLTNRVRSIRWKNPIASALTLAALAPIGLTFWRDAAPIRHFVEYAGLIPQIEKLTTQIGVDDLLIVEARSTGSELHLLALPLAYIYGKHVLLLSSALPDKRGLEHFVTWAQTRYRQVLFLGGGGTDLLTKRITAQQVMNDAIHAQEYDAPHNAYPDGPKRKDWEFGIYRLVAAPQFVPGPIDLTIGMFDDLNVVRFYAREQHADGTMFRWTKDRSFVTLLGVPPNARKLSIWLSNGGRPPQAPPATVQLAFEASSGVGSALTTVVHPLGSVTPDAVMRQYDVDLPPDVVAWAAAQEDPIRLSLKVPTWIPADVLPGRTDTRDLGVMLTRVAVR